MHTYTRGCRSYLAENTVWFHWRGQLNAVMLMAEWEPTQPSQ